MSDGTSRPNSGSFKPKRGEPPSVFVETVLLEHDLTAENALDGHETDFWLVAVTAGLLREQGLGVVLNPDQSDLPRGYAHALITGPITGTALDALTGNAQKIVWDIEGNP
jgi:hypothetical protein